MGHGRRPGAGQAFEQKTEMDGRCGGGGRGRASADARRAPLDVRVLPERGPEAPRTPAFMCLSAAPRSPPAVSCCQGRTRFGDASAHRRAGQRRRDGLGRCEAADGVLGAAAGRSPKPFC